jgi:selenocysteine-specific elongation factor
LPSAPRPLKAGERVAWHSGTAEVVAAARYWESDPIQPGATGWVQWRLGATAALRKGDLYVIRRLSPPMTIGGGEIVRTMTRHVPRGNARALEGLELARRASPTEVVTTAVATHGPMTRGEIARRTELAGGAVAAAVDDEKAAGRLATIRDYVLTVAHEKALVRRIRDLIDSDGGAAGISRATLPPQLGAPAPVVAALLGRLAESGEIVLSEGRVHTAKPSSAHHDVDPALVTQITTALDRGGFAPQDLSEVARAHKVTNRDLEAMANAGLLLRVTLDFGLSQAGYRRWLEAIGRVFSEHERVTVGQLRDRLGTSRKFILAFLEHLDSRLITRRVGDARVLLDRTIIPDT